MEEKSLDTALSVTEVADKIFSESDPKKTQDLIELFNWNINKKHILRTAKLDSLFDDITEQMVLRFKTKPDQFSNEDLLNYMKTVQSAIDNNAKSIDKEKEPPKIMQQNNTQINLNIQQDLTSESRARVLAAINSILNKQNYIENSNIECEDNSDEL